jgi:hypothetical protein
MVVERQKVKSETNQYNAYCYSSERSRMRGPPGVRTREKREDGGDVEEAEWRGEKGTNGGL